MMDTNEIIFRIVTSDDLEGLKRIKEALDKRISEVEYLRRN